MQRNLTRTEIRKEQTKDNIINASLEVFEKYGYANARVNEITDKANVGYGTFYQYFKNKKELLIFLLDDVSDHIGDYMYLKTHKNLDIKERLYHGVLDILNFHLKYKTIFLILPEAEMIDNTFIGSNSKIQDNLYKRIDHDIQYFVNKGYCRKSVSNMTVFAIFCMIDGYAKQIIKMPEKEIDTSKIARVLAEISYNTLFSEEVNRKALLMDK